MSLMIWKPNEHEGFTNTLTPNGYKAFSSNYKTENDEVTAYIARFTGQTTAHYRDTWECSFTADASQVSPDQLKMGYFVDVDGHTYRIETVKWEMQDGRYTVEFGGRGVESYFDQAVCERMCDWSRPKRWNAIADYTRTDYDKDEFPRTVTPDTIIKLVKQFMDLTGCDEKMLASKIPCATDGLMHDFLGGDVKSEIEYKPGDYSTDDRFDGVNDYGSVIRTLCAYINAGYRVDVKHIFSVWNRRIHQVDFTLYNFDPAKAVNIEVGKIRGITNVAYETSCREAVNRVLYVAHSGELSQNFKERMHVYARGAYGDIDMLKNYNMYFADFFPNADTTAGLMKKGRASSFWDMVNIGGAKIVDIGQIPDELESDEERIAWIRSKMTYDDIVPISESFSFDYDNSGHLKYGQNLKLGSWVNFTDGFLGVSSKQLLTKVTTKYEAGKAKGYTFDFGYQRITAQDKIKSRFAKVDQRGAYNKNGVGI